MTDWSSDGGINVFSDDGQFIKKISCNSSWNICLTPDVKRALL